LQGQLSQKERMLLEDLKKEEDLCVTKYEGYSRQAQDASLSQLFSKLASEEQKHYDTVSQLLQSNGQSQSGQQGQGQGQSGQGGQKKGAGQMGQSGQSSSGSQLNLASQGLMSSMSSGQSAGQTNAGQAQSQGNSSSDKYMLHDMLSMEKYVSSAYDTSVFESSQPNVRKALQQIQQEEQGHGEQIYQYMSSHGMYQTQ